MTVCSTETQACHTLRLFPGQQDEAQQPILHFGGKISGRAWRLSVQEVCGGAAPGFWWNMSPHFYVRLSVPATQSCLPAEMPPFIARPLDADMSLLTDFPLSAGG